MNYASNHAGGGGGGFETLRLAPAFGLRRGNLEREALRNDKLCDAGGSQ